jgi:hypothetical protein
MIQLIVYKDADSIKSLSEVGCVGVQRSFKIGDLVSITVIELVEIFPIVRMSAKEGYFHKKKLRLMQIQ